jgi:SH2 domain
MQPVLFTAAIGSHGRLKLHYFQCFRNSCVYNFLQHLLPYLNEAVIQSYVRYVNEAVLCTMLTMQVLKTNLFFWCFSWNNILLLSSCVLDKMSYALSVRDFNEVTHEVTIKHYRIRKTDNGGVYVSPKKTFSDLLELVGHYHSKYIAI